MTEQKIINLEKRVACLETSFKNFESSHRSKNKINRNLDITPKFLFGKMRKFDSTKPTMIHNPKTAGRIFHSTYAEFVNYFTHLPAFKIKENKPKYVNSESFAFIRNPYSRFLSAYNFSARRINRSKLFKNKKYNVNHFCETFSESKIEWSIQFNLQHTEHFLRQIFFVQEEDKIIVNHLFKYEEFEKALPILETIGIKNATNFKIKYGINNDWKTELTAESKKIIENEYEKDFELWESI